MTLPTFTRGELVRAADLQALADAVGSGNTTFTQAGTGAVERSVSSKLRETVSVTDFGAVGDGVTDDTAAIQAAINAVQAKKGRVVLPATASGVYMTGPLSIGLAGQRWTCEIVGESWNGDIGQSNAGGVGLKLLPGVNASLFTVATTAAPARFENLRLDGNRSTQTGIVQGGSDRSYGVWFVDASGSTKQRSGHFYNCRIESFASGGVRVGQIRNAGTMDRVTILNVGRTETGTAQAGGAATITLASAATAVDSTYNAMNVVITGGTGAGQLRTISTYVGATRVATVSSAWEVVPDATSTYRISLVLGDALLMGSCNDWRIARCDFGGATRNGYYSTGAGSVTFIGTNLFVCDQNGAQFDPTSLDVQFLGGSIDTNYQNGVWCRGNTLSADANIPKMFNGVRFSQNGRGQHNTYSDIKVDNDSQVAIANCNFVRGSRVGSGGRLPKYLLQTSGTTARVGWAGNAYVMDGGDTFATGTAQGGSASTITLAAGASSTTDYYQDAKVFITSGTGSGQALPIDTYNGTTKVATVTGTFAPTPDATSVYKISPQTYYATDLANDRSMLTYIDPEVDAAFRVTSPANGWAQITGPNPRLLVVENDAAANTGTMFFDHLGGTPRWAVASDGLGTVTPVIEVSRSTSTAQGVRFLGASGRGANGRLSLAFGNFVSAGDAQTALHILRRTTINATPLRMLADGATTSGANSIPLTTSTAYMLTGQVIARDTSTNDVACWNVSALIKMGVGVATTAVVGAPTITQVYADAAVAACTLAITADTTNGCPAITATGQAAKTIRWVGRFETVEVG